MGEKGSEKAILLNTFVKKFSGMNFEDNWRYK